MDSINPLAGSLFQTTEMQRQQSARKTREVRHAKVLSSQVDDQDDELEHLVETGQAVAETHDEHPEHEQSKKKKHAPPPAADEDSPAHLDLTA